MSTSHLNRSSRWSIGRWVVLPLLTAFGCGDLGCPEPFEEVDGVCLQVDPFVPSEPPPMEPDPPAPPADDPPPPKAPPPERCNGLDDDGDDDIDEDWPELGEPCGEAVGECAPGVTICNEDGDGVTCDGAVGPTPEVCDGRDNDCDGIEDNGPAEVCDGEDNDCDGMIDEGVRAVKRIDLPDQATVAAVDGGFVVTRVVGDELWAQTYGPDGEPSTHRDEFDSPVRRIYFLESDTSAQGRVFVAFGGRSFYVAEVNIDERLVPVMSDPQPLNDDWNQSIDWGIYTPPAHPRISAMPPRFVGHRDLITFALSPFSEAALQALEDPPTVAPGLPYGATFDAAGAFVVWTDEDKLRAGWLLDNGSFLREIDVGVGGHGSISVRDGGPGIAYLRDGDVVLSELAGASLACRGGHFCTEVLDAEPIDTDPGTVTGLGYDDITDTWLVAADDQILVVARNGSTAEVVQSRTSPVRGRPPTRIDVVWSEGTAAVVQVGEYDDSVLTFMGCF